MWNDLRFGFRTLRRSPVFTIVAVLSLALGIGANTSIFSLLSQVMFRYLPVADPESLVVRVTPLNFVVMNLYPYNAGHVMIAPRRHLGSLAEATARLAAGDFFISHVDIVVAVGQGRCDSIGGNVSNLDVGGSVTKSTWRLDDQGCLSDPRKPWIGVVRNDL